MNIKSLCLILYFVFNVSYASGRTIPFEESQTNSQQIPITVTVRSTQFHLRFHLALLVPEAFHKRKPEHIPQISCFLY
ncbi:MAG: hypothetical protein ACK481_03660 [Candidatus Melainabacteria bacterium]